MKGNISCLWIASLSFASLSSGSPLPAPTVVERGRDHRVWERVTTNTLHDGRVVTNKSGYVELATGMHYFRDGEWQESRDVIELVANGAVAHHGPCPAAFSANLRAPGAIEIVSDGLRFRSNPLGIAYTDAGSGRSVMLAELQDCVGELIPPNQIIYRNAFDGLNADVLYIYRKDGLEQFVILRENPPPPAAYQMNEATVRLEAWTEFMDPPVPARQENLLRQETDPAARQAMIEPDFRDQTLNWGALSMGPGGAFPMANDLPGELDNPAAPVGKMWIQQPDTGRTFLIEQVEYPAIKAQLEFLPRVSAVRRPGDNAAQMARAFPARPNGAAATTRPMQMAQAAGIGNGFVIDYSLLNAGEFTNFVFKGDTTYFLSGGVISLWGTSVIEGGAVLKYTNSPSTLQLKFRGPVECRTDAYRPATNLNVITNLVDTGIFESVGAGAHYLPANSPYIGIGSSSVNATLLSDLRQRTTEPPIVLASNITFTTTLVPRAKRDTNSLPTLGYHYDPLDYVASQIALTNAVLTMTPGTVLGTYGATNQAGLWLLNGAMLFCDGAIPSPVRVVRYNLAQEQANTNWSSPTFGLSIATPLPYTTNLLPTDVRFRFTHWSMPAGGQFHFYAASTNLSLGMTNCEFHGGRLNFAQPNVNIANCLFHRTYTQLSASSNPFGISLHNSTFFGGRTEFENNAGGPWTVKDNIFDQVALFLDFVEGTVSADYNAYTTNVPQIDPSATHDVLLAASNITYEIGPLGRFYLPTNSPLTNVGSRLASEAGLFHFTTATNQVKETNSTVDIGFHYVALGTNGLPPDFDSDGVSDYEEDENGDGNHTEGERVWYVYDTDRDYDGLWDQHDSNSNDPASDPRRLGYWRFNTTNYLGELGEAPITAPGVLLTNSWSSNAVSVTTNNSHSGVLYRETDYALMTNGGKTNANFNCRQGTMRFWFRPRWSSGNVPGGTGPQGQSHLLVIGQPGSPSGLWQLIFDSDGAGTNILFQTQSNGVTAIYFKAIIRWTNGLWHQLALTYSPSNIAFYVDGRPSELFFGHDLRPSPGFAIALNNVPGGILNYPAASARRGGLYIGQGAFGNAPALGDFDELETFNYPLSPAEIARDFPNARGLVADPKLDTDYDGRSDHLEREVDGYPTNDASKVILGRLGYWRFNSDAAGLTGEQGQLPILSVLPSLTPGWSSNVLGIGSGYSPNRVVFRDVETNGWANINCRMGTVAFWFKPDNSCAGPGKFLYVGTADEAEGDKWELATENIYSGCRLTFKVASNAVTTTVIAAPNTFAAGKWHHIALTYTNTGSTLYTNGVVAGTGSGVTTYPALNFRTNGLVIGNNTAGTSPINGQFDELETFNYPLTAAEIQRRFAMVHSVDNDLNGVPDLLEDPVLSAPVPIVGVPFVVTGCIEAEQFDRGGQGVAYNSLGGNTVTNDYRPSMMQIVTNTTDFAAGYIVDNLRAGEWLSYSLDVRAGQNYAVEARAAGISAGGMFRIEFYTNGLQYYKTPILILESSSWTNARAGLAPLVVGTNLMKVVMLTNGVDGQHVGKLNYISIYPDWVGGVTNIIQTNDLLSGNFGAWRTSTDWGSAMTNGVTLQKAIDDLTNGLARGGLVLIPEGTFHVAQPFVNETLDAQGNSAAVVVRNNVEIRGAGKAQTKLVTHNRATTVFYIGHDRTNLVAVTNFTLSDLTVEGRPHLVSVLDTNTGAFTNFWETGALNPIDSQLRARGNLVVFGGKESNKLSVNLLFTNCLFKNSSFQGLWSDRSCISNVVVRNCDFVFRDGTNGAFPFPRSITNTNISTTQTNLFAGVGFFVRVCDSFVAQNVLILDCTYNGNPALTALSPINTNFDASDGIFFSQGAANCFVSRCAITNYSLEGIQFGQGPAAAVANDYHTFVSLFGTVSLMAHGAWLTITSATNVDSTFYFVGNRVVGGRFGYAEHPQPNSVVPNGYSRPIFSGNYLELTPPYDLNIPNHDELGGAFDAGRIEHANIAGNKLVAGGHGARWQTDASSGLVLKNDFAAASFRALAYAGTNTTAGPAFRFTIFRNTLGQGTQFHLKGPIADPGIFFSSENTFKDGALTVNPFIDPAFAPVHTRHLP